jgi:hypothetical protein
MSEESVPQSESHLEQARARESAIRDPAPPGPAPLADSDALPAGEDWARGLAGEDVPAPGAVDLPGLDQDPLADAQRVPRLSGRGGSARRGRRLVKPAPPTPPLTAEQRLLLDTWQRSGLPAGDFTSPVGVLPGKHRTLSRESTRFARTSRSVIRRLRRSMAGREASGAFRSDLRKHGFGPRKAWRRLRKGRLRRHGPGGAHMKETTGLPESGLRGRFITGTCWPDKIGDHVTWLAGVGHAG